MSTSAGDGPVAPPGGAAVQQARHEEKCRATVALNDLRSKLHLEKTRELTSQKELLQKKFECDLQKVTRLKDTEVQKIQSDLQQCRLDLSEVTEGGLTGVARDSLEAERRRLLVEVQELRVTRRAQEQAALAATESERQNQSALRRTDETWKRELARGKKENAIEIRKLLDELKSKDRVISQLERDATMPKWRGDQVDDTGRTLTADRWSSSRQTVSCPDGQTCTGSRDDVERERKLHAKISELNAKIRRLDGQCSSSWQEKIELTRRLKEMEKRHKPLQDKNRKFLEKNMSLTATNRSLEEKLQRLSDEATKLKTQVDRSKKDNQKLSDRLTFEKLESGSFDQMMDELAGLRRLAAENDKSITAMRMSCAEKDRKIEQITLRRRKERYSRAQQKVAGIKETYYGYDEDCQSVDSEMSTSSRRSSSFDLAMDEDEDEVFDEFTREEYAKNYQRLVQEHLELEKSYALLQAHTATPNKDPQRAAKAQAQLEIDLLNANSCIKDMKMLVKEKGHNTAWLEEKNELNNKIHLLTTKVRDCDAVNQRSRSLLADAVEENEVLEFRILELEENNQQLADDVIRTASLSPSTSVDESEEKDSRDDQHVRDGEKRVLEEAVSMLDIADKKIKELLNTQKSLEIQVEALEQEKDQLKTRTEQTDSIIEQLNVKLEQAQLAVGRLEAELEASQQQEAVSRYTQDFHERAGSRYQGEIDGLKRQLSSSHEGRDFESSLLVQKLDQLTSTELRVTTLEEEKSDLEKQVALAVLESSELRQQLESEQETTSLTESDADRTAQLIQLQTRVSQHEKAESEATEKNARLEAGVVELNAKLAKSTDRGGHLEATLESMRAACITMATDLTAWKERAAELATDGHQAAALQRSVDALEATNRDLRVDLHEAKTAAQDSVGRPLALECRVAEMEASDAQLRDTIADLERLQQLTLNSEVAAQRSRIAELTATAESRAAHAARSAEQLDALRAENVRLADRQGAPLAARVRELEASEAALERRLETQLRELELVREAGARLVDKVDTLEESEARMRAGAPDEGAEDGRLKARLWQLEAVVERLQGEGRSEEGGGECERELELLRGRVDLLLDSEEQLCAQLEQREAQLVTACDDVERADLELAAARSALEQRTLELAERATAAESGASRTSELEQSERMLKATVAELAERAAAAERGEAAARHDLEQAEQRGRAHRDRVAQLERAESAARSAADELAAHNADLTGAVKTLQLKVASTFTRPQPCPAPAPVAGRLTEAEMAEEMEGLRWADAARRREVEALGAHLDCFRHALQGAAIGIELDVGDGVHVSKIGPKLTDMRLERELGDLVRSEGELKTRLLAEERKCSALRCDLEAAEKSLMDQETEFREGVEAKDLELDEVRKNEARLRNELRYGADHSDDDDDDDDHDALAKIQHLESLVFDLEASERQLQGQLDASETRLKFRSRGGATEQRADAGGSALGATEKALLTERISRLQDSERELIRMVETMQTDRNVDSRSHVIFESSDSLLRHRISEHEAVELQLKQKLLDSERRCSELSRAALEPDSRLRAELAALATRESESARLAAQLTARLAAADSALERRAEELAERRRTEEGRAEVGAAVAEQGRLAERALAERVAELEAAADGRAMELRHAERARDTLNFQLSELEVGRRAAADDAARLEDDIRQLQRQLSEQGQGRGAGALREERLRAQADELASGKAAAERRWREAQAAGVAATATVAQLTQRLDAFNSQKDPKDIARRSKVVQVKLVDYLSLKRMSSNDILYAMTQSNEFRATLDRLRSTHPHAYEDFLALTRPTFVNVSHVRVRPNDLENSLGTTPAQKAGGNCIDKIDGSEDDMTMSMNFSEEIDDGQSESSNGVAAVQCTRRPPPLPHSLPPPVSPTRADCDGATKQTNGELPETSTMKEKIAKLEREIQSRDQQLSQMKRRQERQPISSQLNNVTCAFCQKNRVENFELTKENDLNDNTVKKVSDSASKAEAPNLSDGNLQMTNEDLRKIILKLNGQLKDYERIDLERQSLQTKVKAIEKKLKQMCENQTEILKSNSALKLRLETVNEETCKADQNERGSLRKKIETMEKMQAASQLMLTPLRARVIRLARKCNAKDELIGQLAAELRRTDSSNGIVETAELERLEGATEDYNRPISPLTAEFDLKSVDTLLTSPRSVIGDASGEDNEITSLLGGDNHRTRVDHRGDRRPDHGGDHRVNGYGGAAVVRGAAYRATRDFHPPDGDAQGACGLLAGDTVTLLGPVDSSGCVQVALRGNACRVPFAYLQPSPSSKTRLLRKQSLPGHNGVDFHHQGNTTDVFFAQSVPVTPTGGRSPAASRSSSPNASLCRSQRRRSSVVRHPAFGQVAARSPFARAAAHTESQRATPPTHRETSASGSSTLPRGHKVTPTKDGQTPT